MITTKTFAVGHRFIELRVYVPMMKISEIITQTNEATGVMELALNRTLRDTEVTLSSNRAGLHYATFTENNESTIAALEAAGWNRSKGN